MDNKSMDELSANQAAASQPYRTKRAVTVMSRPALFRSSRLLIIQLFFFFYRRQ